MTQISGLNYKDHIGKKTSYTLFKSVKIFFIPEYQGQKLGM